MNGFGSAYECVSPAAVNGVDASAAGAKGGPAGSASVEP